MANVDINIIREFVQVNTACETVAVDQSRIQTVEVNTTTTISGDSTGMPWYNIPAGTVVTVPVNRQHLISGEMTIEGELINEGEVVVL